MALYGQIFPPHLNPESLIEKRKRVKIKGLAVGHVTPGSIAAELEVEPGDAVVSVNGQDLTDVLDYYFAARDGLVVIGLKKKDGQRLDLEIEKDPEEDIGIEFSSTGLEKVTRCANKCVFCFVDQMPRGMRDSLYIKDDDYRLSFLQGSFVTLTNLADLDIDRIARLRLSPLYVSVHTTDPGLRVKLMGSPRAGKIMDQLERLVREGIEIHTQAVICPGMNDGALLDRTISDLAGLWPGVKSLAVVPVGLTGTREGLFAIRRPGPGEAADIVDLVEARQDGFIKSFNHPFVFASDEFYLLAGREIPPRRRYADFPQTENGVGLARIFLDEWQRVKKKIPEEIERPLEVALVTGALARPLLAPVARRLNRVKNLSAVVVAVENSFFGSSVTVAGLLTGRDILGAADRIRGSRLAVLPSSVMRRDVSMTLDGMTREDLEASLGLPVKTASGPSELVNLIFGLNNDKRRDG